MKPLTETHLTRIVRTYESLDREARRRVFHYTPYQIVLSNEQLINELRAIDVRAAYEIARRIAREGKLVA